MNIIINCCLMTLSVHVNVLTCKLIVLMWYHLPLICRLTWINFGGWVLIWHSYWPSSLLLTRLIRKRQLSGYWNSMVYLESPVYVCWPTVSNLIFSLLSCRRSQDTCEHKTILLKNAIVLFETEDIIDWFVFRYLLLV